MKAIDQRWLFVALLMVVGILYRRWDPSLDCDSSRFESFDGIELHYLSCGSGRPVVLLHGLMVDSRTSWIDNGLAEVFVESGRRVIMLDARGHGESDMPHDPAAYADRAMAKDVSALLDHLGLNGVDLAGYSLGSGTALEVAQRDERVRSLALGGIGNDRATEAQYREVAPGLLAAEPPPDSDHRVFADDVGADRLAVAAWFSGAVLPQVPAAQNLADIRIPVLVVNGSDDAPPQEVASRLPNGNAVRILGDHFSVLEQPAFADAFIRFWDGVAAWSEIESGA